MAPTNQFPRTHIIVFVIDHAGSAVVVKFLEDATDFLRNHQGLIKGFKTHQFDVIGFFADRRKTSLSIDSMKHASLNQINVDWEILVKLICKMIVAFRKDDIINLYTTNIANLTASLAVMIIFLECIPYVSLGEISLNDVNIILYGVNCKETTGEMEYNPLSINCAEFLKQLKEGREPVHGELSVAGVIACMAREYKGHWYARLNEDDRRKHEEQWKYLQPAAE